MLMHTSTLRNKCLFENIDPIISNGVRIIGGKNFILKVLEQLDVPELMMEYNCIKTYWRIYSTFQTQQKTSQVKLHWVNQQRTIK